MVVSCSIDGRAVPPRMAARHSRALAPVTGLMLLALVTACGESRVPYFTAPTSITNSPTGVQNAVTGLVGGMRDELSQTNGYYVGMVSTMARDALQFLPEDITTAVGFSGEQAIFPGDNGWSPPFQYAKQANDIIAILPQVAGYTSAQVAAITGIAQTMKALNFIWAAELRDTLGIPIYTIQNGLTSPFYCNKDVWKYIVALLDSGFTDLNTAGAIPLPVVLPPGFASVGTTAAPSTTPGAFAAFNRALAGKAGLELAYAIARGTPGTSPTPTSPGAPDAAALVRADSALTASALYNLGAISPPVPGPFVLDPYGVYETYSGESGDYPNPLNQYYSQTAPMQDLLADVDSANDLRWKNKFVPNPLPLQPPEYAPVGVQASYLPGATVSGPVPLMRAEELALVRSEIHLGLGDYPGAISLINTVHQQAGGMPALTIAPSYTAVRDTLMKEIRISTVLEGGGDHLIAIRMWGMASVSDTTWIATSGPDALAVAAVKAVDGGTPVDYHTTVVPVPTSEIQSRGGSYPVSCP
jgi:starch-binding outer membrane protein, SusD/RagB family